MNKRKYDIVLRCTIRRVALSIALLGGLLLLCAPLRSQNPLQDPQFECVLQGPDTIRFMNSRYVPDEFYLDVDFVNIGEDSLTNVRLSLLGNRRFTLLSAQSIVIGNIPPSTTIHLSGDSAFHLRTNLNDDFGYDTLYVFVQGDAIGATVMLPIYVEKATWPRLELYCEAIDSLNFDPLLNEYYPSPFPVKTIVRNVGDGPAGNCSISYTGPSSVSPLNGENTIAVGVLGPGETKLLTWQMVPRRRDSDKRIALPFRVQGEGGQGQKYVTADCTAHIYIPAARAIDYECTLDIDAVLYDSTNKRYSPDPFMIRSQVTNRGTGAASGMIMLTQFESGLVLSPGQSVVDTLAGALDPGESSGVYSKSLRPLLQKDGDSLLVTVIFIDRFGSSTRCEKLVWIPPADEPTITLQCSSELDSLVVDPVQGGYMHSQFSFLASVENNGPEPLYDVSLYALTDPEGTLLIDHGTQLQPISSALLDSDGVRQASWNVQAVSIDTNRLVYLRVLAIARNSLGYFAPLVSCETVVFVPRVGKAQLQCGLATSVTDGNDDMVISFDTACAKYEGIPSLFGDYRVFRLTADVVNIGEAPASPVEAALLLPQGLRLEEGEPPTKVVEPSRIAPGEHASVSWLIRPERSVEKRQCDIELLVSNIQTLPAKCELNLTLAKTLNIVTVSIPPDLTGVAGSILAVPINIGETPGIDPGAYQFVLRFDPLLLRFIEAGSDESRIAHSWRNLNTRLISEDTRSGLNLLAVADSTGFSPRERNDGGPLVHLYFEVIHSAPRLGSNGYVVETPLQFVRYPFVSLEGDTLAPFVHSYASDGGLTPVFYDGEATLSGDCVLPLSAATRLLPNRPNPFNPVTQIPFYLAEYSSYRIVLLDAFGRFLRLIVQGSGPRGFHSVHFDAGDLPSGLYYYQLETAKNMDIRRMLLTK